MSLHLVEWSIEVEAETPEEAAREALRIQRDPNSIATVFTVKPENCAPFGKGVVQAVEIDLGNEDN